MSLLSFPSFYRTTLRSFRFRANDTIHQRAWFGSDWFRVHVKFPWRPPAQSLQQPTTSVHTNTTYSFTSCSDEPWWWGPFRQAVNTDDCEFRCIRRFIQQFMKSLRVSLCFFIEISWIAPTFVWSGVCLKFADDVFCAFRITFKFPSRDG
jgi:hypothetical protein